MAVLPAGLCKMFIAISPASEAILPKSENEGKEVPIQIHKAWLMVLP